jgi:23S rRNA pseudouridine2605 synthase
MIQVREAKRQTGLARTLSKLGYCSRSRAAGLIRAGRVTLNGKIHRNPETPVPGSGSQITVDGTPIEDARKIYLMLNKPRGVVTTASDEKGRETVYDLLRPASSGYVSTNRSGDLENLRQWIAPVGRLDKASEGLLLMTNDCEWAAIITAPETHLEKTYHVQIATVAEDNFIQTLLRGVKAKNGEVLRLKRLRRLRSGGKNCWLEIVLDEGKNRQIRRMIEAVHCEVLRLVRVAIGPLQLGDLAKGKYRSLTADEKQSLDCAKRRKNS